MVKESRIAARLPFRVPDDDVSQLIRDCRAYPDIDLQVAVSLPESPSEGGWVTRPHCRGGPDVFISITAPTRNRDRLVKFLEKLLAVYEWRGNIEELMAPL